MLVELTRLCWAVPVTLASIVGATATSVKFTLTATVLAVGGIGFPTVDQSTMKAALGGIFDDGTNTFVNVPWPGEAAPVNGTLKLGQSIAIGTENLYSAINNTPGPKVASGVSGSAIVINEVMRRLIDDPDAPTPDELSFVIVADAERGILSALTPLFGTRPDALDYTVRPMPVTPYDVMVVKGEYDGLADWPDRPWNLLAVFNALAGTGIWPGFRSTHWDTIWQDPTTAPTENITTTVNDKGGVTTTYLVPVAELPILQPLRDQGMPESTISWLNSVLKPLVDLGYRRNDWRTLTVPLRGPQVRVGVRPAQWAATAESTPANRSFNAATKRGVITRADRPHQSPSGRPPGGAG